MKKRILCTMLALVMMVSIVVTSGLQVSASKGEVMTEDQIDPNNVLVTFTPSNMGLPYSHLGDCIVDDPDASEGKAVRISYEIRSQNGADAGNLSALIRNEGQDLILYTYGGVPATALNHAWLTVSQLQANAEMGKYMLYMFKGITWFPTNDNYYFFTFDDWGFQLFFTPEQIEQMAGKPLDLYLSMKITGDISDSEENTPTYYIDKVIITSAAGNLKHEHVFGKMTATENAHEAQCQTCGEQVKESHKWDDGVITKEPTDTEDGEKQMTCTVCGETKTESFKASFGNHQGNTQNTPKPQTQAQPNDGNDGNIGIWVAVGMIGFALIVIVLAVVLLRKKKDDK